MANYIKKNIWFVLIACFFFLLDGTLAQFLSPMLYTAGSIMIPRLLLFTLILGSFYYSERFIIIFSLVLGLLYDSYYSGLLGVYAAIMPLVLLLVVKTAKYVNDSFIMTGFIFVIAISIFEFCIFGFQYVNRLSPINMSITDFIVIRLGPTILFNMICFVLLYFPLRKLLVRITSDRIMNS